MISSPVRTEDGCGTEACEDGKPSSPAEQVAILYIDEQLERARRSLRRTRAACLIALFLLLSYMSFITITMRNRLLRPEAAAEMAAYYFSRFAAQNGPVPTEAAGKQPHGLAATKSAGNPERPLHELNPAASGDPLGVEAEATAYVRGYISQHHGKIQDLVREAQHPKTVQQLGDELDEEIREHLPSRVKTGLPDPGYLSYVNQKLVTLAELESQLNRLAHDNDLTPYERALRRVIASTMGNVHGGS